MKTPLDPRHEQRINRVKALFTYSFDVTQREIIEDVLEHIVQIDAKIAQYAKERPLDEINKLDLAILRLGVFELMYDDEIMASVTRAVVIDEAVEIAKSYGGDSSPKFINAVLGKVAENI